MKTIDAASIENRIDKATAALKRQELEWARLFRLPTPSTLAMDSLEKSIRYYQKRLAQLRRKLAEARTPQLTLNDMMLAPDHVQKDASALLFREGHHTAIDRARQLALAAHELTFAPDDPSRLARALVCLLALGSTGHHSANKLGDLVKARIKLDNMRIEAQENTKTP